MFLVTELGDRLREAREAKGYTLDDLQEITKIQKRYLAGIEKEEYKSMPGSFYVRAFIKQYAEAVDLDADEMLTLYKGSVNKEDAEEEEIPLAAPTLSRRSSRSSGQLNQIMPKIVVALFIVVIIGAVLFLSKFGPSKSEEHELGNNPIQVEDQAKPHKQKPDDSVTDDGEKADDESDEPIEEEQQQTIENTSIEGENVTYTLTNAKELQLEIRTTEDSWIGVLDEKQVERTDGARVMTAGESVKLDVSDAETIRIRLGRAPSTEIYINGELLEYVSDRTTQNVYIEYKKGQ